MGMFERRLRIILTLPTVCAAVLIWRLYDIQVIQGDQYAEKADAALLAPRQLLPPLRGRIVDRFGEVLVSDEPAHDVTVHYGALSMNEPYLLRTAKFMPRADSGGGREEASRRIAHMWLALQRITGIPLSELRSRRDSVCRSVENLRRYIWTLRREKGFDEPLDGLRLREEEQFHPILHDVSPEIRTRIELEMSGAPFIRIEPSVRRVWQEGVDSLCHVLGRLGQVSSRVIMDDPERDDELARYRPGDLVGVSGVERLGEPMLRGKRGFEEHYLDGRVNATARSIDGLDVQLTIDLDLQRTIADILAEVVSANPPSTGASCVAIDVETREILALVSVPTYGHEQLGNDYEALRDDTKSLPLLFRAVHEEYQPGSILKPVALLAAAGCGEVSVDQSVFCDGQLIPGSSKWHCWTHWRGMPGHGEMRAEEALQHSCNVFFYTLGQRTGAQRLTDFYRAFLPGPEPAAPDRGGTGLVEERSGLIPSLSWMREHRQREFRPADGRNYAIGQGEIQITPLQAANAFATLAAGWYREPTLIANDGRQRPVHLFSGLKDSDWAMTRRGLFRCVNEEGGTAFKYAHMPELEICGKTGSAQCVPRITRRRYVFERPGASGRMEIVASTVEAAREALELPSTARCIGRKPVEKWPPFDPERHEVPTHAWFAGFAPYRHPVLAIAVVVEFGGGGGATAGTAAKQIFQALLASPRGYLPSSGIAAGPAVQS